MTIKYGLYDMNHIIRDLKSNHCANCNDGFQTKREIFYTTKQMFLKCIIILLCIDLY